MTDTILCGVVIEKSGEMERFCTYEALTVFPLMDDDNVHPIDGITMCQMHDNTFEAGSPLVCATRKGNRYLIQKNSDEIFDIITEGVGTPPDPHNTPAPN